MGSIRVYSAEPPERGVVFLHGVGQSWASWTPVLQAALEAHIDSSSWVIVDLPGFGASADLPEEATLESVGAALLAALAAHGLQEITLVGHSMGGFLALDMLARASVAPTTPVIGGAIVLSGAYAGIVEFVNSPLALARKRPAVATAYSGLWLGSLMGTRPAQFIARNRMARSALSVLMKPVAAHPRDLPDSFVRSLMTELRPRAFRIAARTGIDYDCALEWSKIRLPLLAVFGDEDHLVGAEDRRRLEVACPAATSIVLPDTGHFAPIERPHEVAALVAESRH
jgi:pimeloyl-ACP methyl ester carboxylesterase